MDTEELNRFLALVRKTRFVDYLDPIGITHEEALERRLKWAARSKDDPSHAEEARFLLEHKRALRDLVHEEGTVDEDWVHAVDAGNETPIANWMRRENAPIADRVTEMPQMPAYTPQPTLIPDSELDDLPPTEESDRPEAQEPDEPRPEEEGANLSLMEDITPPPINVSELKAKMSEQFGVDPSEISEQEPEEADEPPALSPAPYDYSGSGEEEEEESPTELLRGQREDLSDQATLPGAPSRAQAPDEGPAPTEPLGDQPAPTEPLPAKPKAADTPRSGGGGMALLLGGGLVLALLVVGAGAILVPSLLSEPTAPGSQPAAPPSLTLEPADRRDGVWTGAAGEDPFYIRLRHLSDATVGGAAEIRIDGDWKKLLFEGSWSPGDEALSLSQTDGDATLSLTVGATSAEGELVLDGDRRPLTLEKHSEE